VDIKPHYLVGAVLHATLSVRERQLQIRLGEEIEFPVGFSIDEGIMEPFPRKVMTLEVFQNSWHVLSSVDATEMECSRRNTDPPV
jgi:hypothetical protein